MTNLDLVRRLCTIMDEVSPRKSGGKYESLITFVKDRPGHDRRYAIDDAKIANEMDWNPRESFDTGLIKTVKWYLANRRWADSIRNGSYREWITRNYENRG